MAVFRTMTSEPVRVGTRRELLRAIFEDGASGLFIVLRNHETLPDEASGTDLDVVAMPGRTVGEVADHLIVSAARAGWQLVRMSQRPHTSALAFGTRRHDGRLDAFHFDVFRDIGYANVELISPVELASESFERAPGVRALSDRMRALATTVHHLTWSGRLSKAKYRDELSDALHGATHRSWTTSHLEYVFGRDVARQIGQLSSEGRLGEEDRKRRSVFRLAAIRRAFARRPRETGIAILRYIGSHLATLVSPAGIVGMAGDRVPGADGDLRLDLDLACGLSPHGFRVRSVRSNGIETLNGERYQNDLERVWMRTRVVRRVAPSAFLWVQAKRNRVVIVDEPPPMIALFRRLGLTSWVSRP